MSLIAAKSQFVFALTDIWDNPTETTTVYDTADAVELFWQNSRVTGYEITPSVIIPQSTYSALAPLLTPTGTAATAAAAFEASFSNLVLTTLYTIIVPPFTTPPPVPTIGGVSLPGLLTTALTVFFGVLSPESKAVAFADIVSAYLMAWSIMVTVPPAAAAPVPII